MRSRRLFSILLLAAGCSAERAPPAPPGPPEPAPESPSAPPAPPAPPPDPEPRETEPDPIRRRTRIEESWFRTNFPVEGHHFRFHDLRPFLVAEVLPDASRPGWPATQRLYESVLPRVVASVQRFFREVAAVDLPPLEDLGDERLRWLVFPSREQFDGWHSGRGVRNPGAPYVQAGADGLVVTHLDDVLGDSLAWLAATQCLARWKRHFCQQDDDAMADARGLPREPVTRDDRRLQCSYSWLERGLQSRFADAGWTATMDRRPIAGHPTGGEYAFVKREMDRSELWPLEDMLFADVPQVWVRARERGWENLATRLDRLHAAQSFVLVDTLLNGEGGRWREGFAALLRREIRGVSGKVYLLEAFGLPRRSDAPEVKRWIAEVEKACLDRLVPAEPK